MKEDVQDEIGKALQRVQWGGRPQDSTPLKGFRGASVQEIKVDEDTDTYRCIYTVQFVDAIYVLHVFKKKSHEKDKTPKRDMDLVVLRLRAAEQHYRNTYSSKEEGKR